ncbi:MAG: sulfatase [Planctomycetota bacterium]
MLARILSLSICCFLVASACREETPPAGTSRTARHLAALLESVDDDGGAPRQKAVHNFVLPEPSGSLPAGFAIEGDHRTNEAGQGVRIEPSGETRRATLLVQTPLAASSVNLILLQVRIEGDGELDPDALQGRLYWRGPGESFSEERFSRFPLPPEAAYRFGMVTIPVGDLPSWRGDIEEIRLVPFDGERPVSIARVLLARASFKARLKLTGRSTERIPVGDVVRRSVLELLPAVLRAEVDIPPEAEIRLHLAGGPMFEGTSGAIELTLNVIEDGERKQLASTSWQCGEEGRAWQEWRVDLSKLKGKVTLELAAEGIDAPDMASLILGDPVLSSSGARPRPNVILISLDTLRADHLSCYGYPVPTSPNLDALAAKSTLFERAHGQAPYTLPSHASLFTSLYPDQHGFLEEIAPPTDIPTLGGLLSNAGYLTAGFTDGGFMTEFFGMGQGFGCFDESGDGVETVFERGMQWLEGVGEDPFFLFLHTYEIHSPYDAPEDYRKKVTSQWASLPERITSEEILEILDGEDAVSDETLEQMTRLYDAGIAYTDDWVGRLIARLDELGLDDNTILIVTSDHGEELGEHGGLFHGRTLYQDQLHVPLIISVPDQERGRRSRQIVELIDVLPTVLDLAHVDRESLRIEGQSLLPILEGRTIDSRWAIAGFGRTTVEGQAVVGDDWKYVSVNRGEEDRVARMDGEFLFRIGEDPLEQENLADEETEARDRMRALLAELRAQWQQDRRSDFSKDGRARNVLHLDAMKRLGYVR